MIMRKLSTCLADLGITDPSAFASSDGVDEEFKIIKRAYQRKILKDHPDKGGDEETFRATRAAWEVLRDLRDGDRVKDGTFASYLGVRRRGDHDDDGAPDDGEEEWMDDDLADLYERYSKNTSVPSYEYYEAAAEEDAPIYKVEHAKTARGKCTKCKKGIETGEVKVGSLDLHAGSYGRYHHLDCWRVPTKIHRGLTNPLDEMQSLLDLLMMEEVLLTGVGSLDDWSKMLFVRHCVDEDNWAGHGGGGRVGKRKRIMASSNDNNAAIAAPSNAPNDAPSNDATSGTAGSFAVLVPGTDGAVENDALKGKTFVMSGTFPEVGGGDAESVGVEIVKAMVESFGGKVITRFSKKANFLLVGQGAPASKLKDATKRSVVIVSLRRLQGVLLGHLSLHGLASFPALTGDMFAVGAYQPAGAPPPPPPPGQHATQSAAAVAAAPESRILKKPKKSDKREESAPPKAVPASTVASSSNVTAAEAAASSKVLAPRPNNDNVTAVVPHGGKKHKFQIPRPGVNGAVSGVLDGKKFVLTGVFPELGGGAALNLGKDKAKAMIESFGGKVTGSVSGKTNYVVVGKDPGRSKVSKANEKNIPLINLISLQRLLMGQLMLESVANEAPPRIENFSAGYPGQKRIAYH